MQLKFSLTYIGYKGMQILLLTPYPQAWPKAVPVPAKQSNPVLHLLPNPFPLPSPDALPPNPYETTTHYDSISAAIQPILASHPQVVAFGEIHPEMGFAYRSTKAYFTEEVLPALAADGIKDLVLEQILSDPAIEAELEKFYSSGCEINAENTPQLWQYTNYSDRQDLYRMLQKCRELGIKVHPGGMTAAQAEETVRAFDYTANQALKLKALIYNGQATRSRIDSLLQQDPERRMAVFGGLIHNNLIDGSNDGTNFGKYLAERFGQSYFEVDLLSPQNESAMDNFGQVSNWRELIPQNGVNLLDRGQTRIIVLPAQTRTAE